MAGIARGRLAEERKNWRKDHPFGFAAKPSTAPDGSTNLLRWQCMIPGKKGGKWEGGMYPVVLEFSEEYPGVPPKAMFPAGFFHPNIFPTGKVCLSILNADKDWRPGITVKQILLGIADLLENPNNSDAAQQTAYDSFRKNQAQFWQRVREEVKKYPDPNGPGVAGGSHAGGAGDAVVIL